MPIQCLSSNLQSDVRCAVCGQGVLVFAAPGTPAQRRSTRGSVLHALRQHHTDGRHVHPASFSVDLPHHHSAEAAVEMDEEALCAA